MARQRLVLALACLLLVGCSTLPPGAPGLDASGVRLHPGSLRTDSGCRMRYQLYRPAAGAHDGDLVVLAAGFLRQPVHLRDLAQEIARRGYPVVTLTACHARIWSGRQVQTGFDMIHLAAALHARRVVYGGFSAGALSALIAARNDPRGVGVVTLDLVDHQGVGRRAMDGLRRPLRALAGLPQPCNAWGNGRLVYAVGRAAGADVQVQAMSGAGHCDFESPTDALCQLVCGTSNAESRGHIVTRASLAAIALF